MFKPSLPVDDNQIQFNSTSPSNSKTAIKKAWTTVRRIGRRGLMAAMASMFMASGCGSNDSTTESLPKDEGAQLKAPTFELIEATIDDVHQAFLGNTLTDDGDPLTCVELAETYLDRIRQLDTARIPEAGGRPLNSIIAENPEVLKQAKELDDAFAVRGLTGPMHCVPVILKDLYDTDDFPTTSASVTLEGSQPPDDAFSVKGLRDAGALILAKSSLSEFAYWTQSYNSRNFQVNSPYDTTKDAGGSSNGTGSSIAANLGLVGTGSDTCASIRLPPSNASLVGVRGTVGLVSQDGLVPLSHSMDVGGPMTRTVRDAAIMLDAMAGVDPADVRTLVDDRFQPTSYVDSLKVDGLKGKRLGVLASYGNTNVYGPNPNAEVVRIMEEAVNDMRAQGAIIIDNITLPDFEEVAETLVPMEFADHLDEYLGSFAAPRANTEEVFLTGQIHPFINNLVAISLAVRDTSSPAYREMINTRKRMRTYVIAEMDRLNLDALVFPPVFNPPQIQGNAQGNTCGFGSTTNMPSIVVPAGFTNDQLPLPVGVEFHGRPWQEDKLFELAYSYEQATKHRRPPAFYR